jgi:hypothetical protein
MKRKHEIYTAVSVALSFFRMRLPRLVDSCGVQSAFILSDPSGWLHANSPLTVARAVADSHRLPSTPFRVNTNRYNQYRL